MTLLPGSTRIDAQRRRGRGAVSNACGRFEATSREGVDDGWPGEEEPLPPLATVVTEERARSIIARNRSPDIPFDRSINPYRGCEHGCVYCYARPSHAFLGLSPGIDFETRLIAKPDAAALLRRELAAPGYRPAPLALGANTDPYQPVERERGITREIVEVLLDHRHPFSITTKSALVLRERDLLSEAAALGLVRVAISVTTLDHRLSRRMEPRACSPRRRLWAIRELAADGVPMMVMAAPMIPALNDHELERILEAARDAGATSAGYVALRMPLEIAGLFREWLETHYPDRATRVLHQVREMHGGRDYDPSWRSRLTGEGVFARLLAQRFRMALARLGMEKGHMRQRCDLFRRPPRPGEQLSLEL